MQILPLSKTTTPHKNHYFTKPSDSINTVNFEGLTPKILPQIKNKLAKYLLLAGGVSIFKEQRFLDCDEACQNDFISLYNKYPEFAEIYMSSGRKMDSTLFYMFERSSIGNEKFKLEGIEFLLNLKNSENRFIMPMHELLCYCDNPEYEQDVNLVLAQKEKIVASLSEYNFERSEHLSFSNIVNMAEVFASVKSLTPEEFGRYINCDFSLNKEDLYLWGICEGDIRKQIIDKIYNNPFFKRVVADYNYVSDSPIILNKNFLEKLDLLLDDELISVIKSEEDILFNEVRAEDIRKGLERFKSLSPEIQAKIQGSTLADIIVKFESLNFMSRFENEKITVNDFFQYAKLIGNLNFWDSLDSEGFYSLPPYSPEFENNTMACYELGVDYGLSDNSLLKLLSCKDTAKNCELLKKLLSKDYSFIFEELALKCRDTNPNFLNLVKEFFDLKSNIVEVACLPNFTEKDIVDALFQISKMQVKFAKYPERFLNGEYSREEIETLKETLQQYLKNRAVGNSIHLEYQNVFTFYEDSIPDIYPLLASTDAEWVNLQFDRRLYDFSEKCKVLKDLNFDVRNIMTDLLKNAKSYNSKGVIEKLSGKQKAILVDVIPLIDVALGVDELKNMIEVNKEPLCGSTYLFNFDNFVDLYNSKIFEKLGVETDKQLQKWDRNYVYKVLNPPKGDEGELRLVFDLLNSDSLREYMEGLDNKYGQSNLVTKELFIKNQLDYNLWLEGIGDKSFKIDEKEYSIGLLSRFEPNSLFMGEYTSCCIGLDRINGDSAANYILNSVFDVLAMRDDKGKIVATARLFMSDIDTKPALIIDSIQLNSELRKLADFTKKSPILNIMAIEKRVNPTIFENFIDYIKDFSFKVAGREIPIYMSNENRQVDNSDYQLKSVFVKPLGEITKDRIYLNCMGVDVITDEHAFCTSLRKIQ